MDFKGKLEGEVGVGVHGHKVAGNRPHLMGKLQKTGTVLPHGPCSKVVDHSLAARGKIAGVEVQGNVVDFLHL